MNDGDLGIFALKYFTNNIIFNIATIFLIMNVTDINNSAEEIKKDVETESNLSDYELYCKQQVEAFEDELGDDRCFGDMAEGMFVRGH